MRLPVPPRVDIAIAAAFVALTAAEAVFSPGVDSPVAAPGRRGDQAGHRRLPATACSPGPWPRPVPGAHHPPRGRGARPARARAVEPGHLGTALRAEATTKTHVSNVLSKLGLRDRVQAVIFAYENGVVVAGERQALGDPSHD